MNLSKSNKVTGKIFEKDSGRSTFPNLRCQFSFIQNKFSNLQHNTTQHNTTHEFSSLESTGRVSSNWRT